MKITPLKIRVSEKAGEISGLLMVPENAECLFLFAHGAGAGMNHSFMEKMAGYLADNHIATLRYNFPYTEKKGKRPDPAPILLKTVEAAYLAARSYAPHLPVLAGGKSMGGRMTSTAASKNMIDGIKGIVFLGFPLHAPGQPSEARAEHLFQVKVPMLFLQGAKDKLADLALLQSVVSKLGAEATIHVIEGADHSFHLPKSAGKNDEEVMKELGVKVKEWAGEIVRRLPEKQIPRG